MGERRACWVCQRAGVVDEGPREPQDGEIHTVACATCSPYRYLPRMRDKLLGLTEVQRLALSGALRFLDLEGMGNAQLTEETIGPLCDSRQIPVTMGERLERLGRWIERQSTMIGKVVTVDFADCRTLLFARHPIEVKNASDLLVDLNYITVHGGTDAHRDCRLTSNGWDWLDGLRRVRPQTGDLCFVAMSFHSRYLPLWEPGFVAGCWDAGYRALRNDKDPHNEPFIDRIIARIRESRFVVADVTERRANGVFFEAGYAMGLGLPVIFTCMEKRFHRVHADIRQYTVLRWKDAAELRERLADRIAGTVGRFVQA